MLANILRDTRYAIRQLMRTPGFTARRHPDAGARHRRHQRHLQRRQRRAAAAAALPEPDSLVRVHEILQKFGRFSVAPATFLDWRQQNTVFERIGGAQLGGATLVGANGAERIARRPVSWDIFDLLQVTPALGRTFRAEEDAPGKDNVVILSHGMWQRRFGGDPHVLGQIDHAQRRPGDGHRRDAGGFAFMPDVEFWRPLALSREPDARRPFPRGRSRRLKPGVTVEQAGAEMKTISERLALQYPDNSANESAEVIGLHENVVAGIVRRC